MMKMTGLFHLFKWENLPNWWLTKYFFAPLYVPVHCIIREHTITVASLESFAVKVTKIFTVYS